MDAQRNASIDICIHFSPSTSDDHLGSCMAPQNFRPLLQRHCLPVDLRECVTSLIPNWSKIFAKRPATPAALLGPFLGLCWAPHGPPGLSSDACGPFRACSGGRGESPGTAEIDVRNVRQRLRPLMGLLGPSWGSVGPLMGFLTCLGMLLGHFRPVLGEAPNLRTQPT